MRRRALIWLFGLILMLPSTVGASPAVPPWQMAPPFSTETAFVTIGGTIGVNAEIADTPALRERGLGYRNDLRSGWGMLFIDQSAAIQTFWMKGMRFCLDIIWIDGSKITGAAENVCPQPGVPDAQLTVYSSQIPVQYVLEMPANWLKNHAFGAGASASIVLPGSH